MSLTTYETDRKLNHDIMERKEQKLNPPRFEVNLIRQSTPGQWMRGIDYTVNKKAEERRAVIICCAILAVCLIGWALMGGGKV